MACVRRQRAQKAKEDATSLRNCKFKTPATLPSGAWIEEKNAWAVARFIEVLRSGKSSDFYDAYLLPKEISKKKTNKEVRRHKSFTQKRYFGKSAGAGLRSDAVALFGSLPVVSPPALQQCGLWPVLPTGPEFISSAFPRYPFYLLPPFIYIYIFELFQDI